MVTLYVWLLLNDVQKGGDPKEVLRQRLSRCRLTRSRIIDRCKKDDSAKTYNRRDSQMVTHSSTSRPVQCLCMAERTGCPVFTDLWSYVLDCIYQYNIILMLKFSATTPLE
jgi:hypothetical protein